MSANYRWFDNRDGSFHSNSWGNSTSPSALGQDIAETLMRNQEETLSGYLVNYAVGMLRITGRTGRFFDLLDVTGDHRFDANTPTPGAHWSEVRELRDDAMELRSFARDLAAADLGRVSLAAADSLEEEAGALEARADLLDDERITTCCPPLAHQYTLPTVRCADERRGAEAIWWDAQADVFSFGGFNVHPRRLGRIIALSLMQGREWVTIGGITVTVNYLVQMLRQTGKAGRFVDFLFDTPEGRFNPNQPTPER